MLPRSASSLLDLPTHAKRNQLRLLQSDPRTADSVVGFRNVVRHRAPRRDIVRAQGAAVVKRGRAEIRNGFRFWTHEERHDAEQKIAFREASPWCTRRCSFQKPLKQSCEQNALFLVTPSLMQVGHCIVAGLPHFAVAQIVCASPEPAALLPPAAEALVAILLSLESAFDCVVICRRRQFCQQCSQCKRR